MGNFRVGKEPSGFGGNRLGRYSNDLSRIAKASSAGVQPLGARHAQEQYPSRLKPRPQPTVAPLLKEAKSAAKKIDVVSVDVGETSCQVPLATTYIAKVEKMGRVGKKRKTTKCSGS
jgi:hypothetical protein